MPSSAHQWEPHAGDAYFIGISNDESEDTVLEILNVHACTDAREPRATVSESVWIHHVPGLDGADAGEGLVTSSSLATGEFAFPMSAGAAG